MIQTNVSHLRSFSVVLLGANRCVFSAVIKDLFVAVEEKNGGKLTPDQVSRISVKLGEMLGNPGSHEVTQNEKGQVRRFFLLPVECLFQRRFVRF